MQRTLLIIATAVLFLNTLVVPTVAHADGGTGNTGQCSGASACKP
jgi:hypothetical protein